MKTTLKQQITAIQKARKKIIQEANKFSMLNDGDRPKATELGMLSDALNDAGSTIAAIQFIGQNKIDSIDELINNSVELLEALDYPKSGRLNIALAKLKLNRTLTSMSSIKKQSGKS